MMRAAFSNFFGGISGAGIVDLVVDNVPDPVAGGASKLRRFYTGDQTSKIADSVRAGDPSGNLLINVVKMFSAPDGNSFTALGRIYSGSVKSGDKVKILGEDYSEDDDEDCR